MLGFPPLHLLGSAIPSCLAICILGQASYCQTVRSDVHTSWPRHPVQLFAGIRDDMQHCPSSASSAAYLFLPASVHVFLISLCLSAVQGSLGDRVECQALCREKAVAARWGSHGGLRREARDRDLPQHLHIKCMIDATPILQLRALLQYHLLRPAAWARRRKRRQRLRRSIKLRHRQWHTITYATILTPLLLDCISLYLKLCKRRCVWTKVSSGMQ